MAKSAAATTATTTSAVTPLSFPLSKQDEVHYPDPEWSHITVNYFKDADQQPPDTLNSGLSTHEMRVARRSDDSPHIAPTFVRIRNIRGRENEYSIHKQGFTIAHLQSRVRDWGNDDELKTIYIPEISDLLKRVTGAREVFQYEWHVRTQTLERSLEVDSDGAVDITGPVRRVHIDESPASARNEFNYYLKPNDPGNEHLRDRHFGIYNVWKPLKTVRRDPLCLCDVRTIADEDLQEGKVTVLNVGEIENFAVRPPRGGRRHEFMYLRGQSPDEALVFRISDTRVDGAVDGKDVREAKRSHGVAHTSFVDPGTENEAPRMSVEVRSFCVF